MLRRNSTWTTSTSFVRFDTGSSIVTIPSLNEQAQPGIWTPLRVGVLRVCCGGFFSEADVAVFVLHGGFVIFSRSQVGSEEGARDGARGDPKVRF